jgi:hypothetical protein
MDTADMIALAGHYPFTPHISMFWHYRHLHSYEFWLKQDMEWLRVSDVVLRIPGESKGGDLEVKEAQRLGIPVFFSVKELIEFLNK